MRMASNNNNEDDPRIKKQKKTEVVEHVDPDSSNISVSLPVLLSAPIVVVVVVPPTLSFETILEEFPDFLFYLLPFVDDRVVWNSIASSNKDIHVKSKAVLPPWPLYYRLPSDVSYSNLSWSPCGTRIACQYDYTNILIFDQRLGPLRRWQATPNVDEDMITDFKFSPDGRYLVSASDDGFVRLWDAVTGNHELLQEWNMEEEEVDERLTGVSYVSISTCSKYIAVSIGTCVFLKDVENRGSTIKSLLPPFAPRIHIDKIQFSSDDRAVFIRRKESIQVWHPHLDADDDDHLITLMSKPNSDVQLFTYNKYKFSNDNTMVAIHDKYQDKGTLWSIDKDHKCLTKKFDFQGSTDLHFTPDGKSIIVNKENGPTLWSIAEGIVINNTLYFLDNGSNTNNYLVVKSLSPNNRQCIVRDSGTDSHYITSYFVK